MHVAAQLVVLLCSLVKAAQECRSPGNEPNPPIWPPTVRVFEPSDSRSLARAVDRFNGRGELSSERTALLFKPGVYVDVNVGLGQFISAHGLGDSPDDVVFKKRALSAAGGGFRSLENVRVEGSLSWDASLRRVVVGGDLEGAGFSASVVVEGDVKMKRSMISWLCRNCALKGKVKPGDETLSLLTIGSSEDNATTTVMTGDCAVVAVGRTPVVAEKPRLHLSETGEYSLVLPRMRHESTGPDIPVATVEVLLEGEPLNRRTNSSEDEIVSLSSVFVAQPSDARDGTLNQKLDSGLHVALTPGVYELEETLMLSFKGQTILGLGFATILAPNDGAPAVSVTAPGVRLAGLVLEASATPGPRGETALLEWLDEAEGGVISDVVLRARHARTSLESLAVIFSQGVVLDNVHLYRSDLIGEAGELSTETSNVVNLGLDVRGADVTAYGLEIANTLKDQLRWRGENGAVYGATLRLPRDASQMRYGSHGHSGLLIDEIVRRHLGVNVVVASTFREAVQVKTAMRVSVSPNVTLVNPAAAHNGQGSILSVVNGEGKAANAKKRVARWP